MNQLVVSLCQSARGVLHHKTTLLDVLVAKHGPDDALRIFTTICPIVHASIGKHLRHSMDHMERAVDMAATMRTFVAPNQPREIHYDIRQRGGMDEHDIAAARQRIQTIDATLQELSSLSTTTTTNTTTTTAAAAGRHLFEETVQACFFLVGYSGCTRNSLTEYGGTRIGFCHASCHSSFGPTAHHFAPHCRFVG